MATLERLSSLPNLACSLIVDPDGSLAQQVGKTSQQEGPTHATQTISDDTRISHPVLKDKLHQFLDQIGGPTAYDDVLIVPPDFTRFHSHSGIITEMIAEYYHQIAPASDGDDRAANTQPPARPSRFQILPALGTHAPMTNEEIRVMFGSRLLGKHTAGTPGGAKEGKQAGTDEEKDPLFVVHDWRNSVETIGKVDAGLVTDATHGMVKDQEWPAQLNTLVWSKRNALLNGGEGLTSSSQLPNLIISIGQVVPHEVLGMANYNKNLFVGVGGTEAINLSHFIGAVHGMERLMGRSQNPLRHILNVASQKFLNSPQDIHLWYILTVVGADEQSKSKSDSESKQGAAQNDKASTSSSLAPFSPAQQPPDVALKGLFIGNDITCYNMACDLSLQLNFILLSKEPKTMVVYLDPSEFHSTWLGNKAIYRTRMAIADGGHLIILAPGVCKFGEDERIDDLIRKYGYCGTKEVLKHMEQEDAQNGDADDKNSLQNNLSAVAHLIHGSTEGRFRVTYCPGHLTKDEVEGVGFRYGDVDELTKNEYDVDTLVSGWNKHDETGEEFYFIKNPALGLWAVPSRFD